MAWSRYQMFLALMMVVTGSINTIATKFADVTYSIGVDGQSRLFDHPFVQAAGMFFGEMSCLLAFKLALTFYTRRQKRLEPGDIAPLPAAISGNQRFNPLIFLPPSMCDLVGTSIMYIGLNLTYASSFQMLRGSVIVFTGLLSVAFLGHKMKGYQWLGIFFVICGLAIVGTSDMITNTNSSIGMNKILTGDLLIVLSQIITATQMVLEEKFVTKHSVPPLQAVGWEGLFGFVTITVLLLPMYYITTGNTFFHNPKGNMEDVVDAFTQIGNSPTVCISFIGTVLSIAFFNFAGVSVTKELSATTRMVLDSVRTLVVWVFSLIKKWQDFHYLQPIGFVVLVAGMCLYNNVIINPLYKKLRVVLESRGYLNPSVEDQLINNEEPPATADVINSNSVNSDSVVTNGKH